MGFYLDQHQIVFTHSYQPPEIHALLPAKLTKINKIVSIKEGDKNLSGSVPFSGSAQNVFFFFFNVYSGPRPIICPSFVENPFCSCCVILLTNQTTKKKQTNKTEKHNVLGRDTCSSFLLCWQIWPNWQKQNKKKKTFPPFLFFYIYNFIIFQLPQMFLFFKPLSS